MTDSLSAQVFVADTFKREARQLKKRDRNLESDLQPLIEQLQNGKLPGDRIPGFADYSANLGLSSSHRCRDFWLSADGSPIIKFLMPISSSSSTQ